MTRKQALAELIANVGAGRNNLSNLWRPAFGDSGHHAMLAFHGSLYAANVLHEAQLPDWRVDIERSSILEPERLFYVRVWPVGGAKRESVSSYSYDQARAWLLSILKALHAQEPE